MKLPEKYLAEMKELLGEETDAYLAAMEEDAFTCIRINTLKISVEEFEKISPFALTPVPWCSEGFYVPKDCRPGLHPYYYAGLYYIQEPSAMSPAAVLPIEEGDLILVLSGKQTRGKAKGNEVAPGVVEAGACGW